MKYRHVRSILRVFNQLLRVLMCRPVTSSSRVPTDGMRNLSTITYVPVQPQTPMQYRPAQSMQPSLTDAMRNFSIGTSTRVASVAVQPQPPMQQIAKTTTNTAVVSLPLVPSSSKLVKPRARPGFGSVGKKIMITANHFLVQLGDKNPHQYDYKASHLGNHGFAYDGNKSAFAAGPLPFENKEFVIVVPEKDGRQHEFKVAVKFVVTKDIDHLRKLLSGRQHDNPQETIQALDIVLREAASHERIIVGRSIFSSPLGNGVDYCRGFCQSLRPTGMGLSLSIDMSNAHQAETGQSLIEEQALEIGSRKSVRKLFGSYDLLDLIKSFQIGRQKEIQSLLEVGPVTNFAHRNHPQSLLKGRFLRFVQDKKSTSVPVQERHRVLDYERVQLLPQTETVERSGQYHDGSDDRSQETHHFNLSQQTLELESDYDTAELRELSNRRRVSNLLQNGFGLRLDELLRSHVERKEQASQSEQQESVFENDGVSQAVQSAKGALSSPPAIPQLSGTEREIINGLRIDMVRLQEQMNSLQSTLETCMKMQHELQRSVQQEVWSALSRLSTSGEDSLETCFLCCDNSSYDFSSDRCGRVHVCSNCAKKINWSKLKESVRHP
ncbi:argonaute 1-like protein [Tanacetum coccineum]|uniref:Argonaute 1-like protein n=1 Tax=Tanacetum coccineum TaxID=301880 RepID=A0ABQ5IC69_9ASTR